MSNPGQPTIRIGDSGSVVLRAQRALRRTPNLGVELDGKFGPHTESAVKDFQADSRLEVDGVVGPHTWHALPDGGPMPLLKEGADGDVVHDLQRVLSEGKDDWGTLPGPIDGKFGPKTRASVEAFQRWGHVEVDGVVGDHTWAVPLHAMNATLETAVGLKYV
ncbi:peptidoglycan-binding domain-containing protein [Spelaeicoccus albus]|uniref:Peptidoglycan hydrolase-like protein with peptidoglycan-binding domain n=1 Tax=Spelaeicoccus albus TaxID=1280376 RepID=A0A7Z0D494_9MICO|nr:peptidoglycan-binding protein [Spelaeicoccus albus]NYI68575.1 peptidoglycan hydrolase-like protein with peptidoglycan-binding domain [Spelaeicoccus albus]